MLFIFPLPVFFSRQMRDVFMDSFFIFFFNQGFKSVKESCLENDTHRCQPI